jgi:hypothetical protein
LPSTAAADATRKTSTCGAVTGSSEADADHVVAFCAQSVSPTLKIREAQGDDVVLYLRGKQRLANTILADKQAADQLMRGWLKQWLSIVKKPTATVVVMAEHTEVARGQTTMSNGDEVTVLQLGDVSAAHIAHAEADHSPAVNDSGK